MTPHRRDCLRKISSVAVVAASGSVLKQDAEAALIHNSHLTGMYRDSELGALRDQFPVLSEQVNGHRLVYLDNAATTQRPRAVIDALAKFYLHDNANPAKSLHTLARRSATLYEKARETVAKFVHARGPDEIVWTHGTTEAINLVASSWGGANLHSGDEIILTVSKHYSSLVPWQLAAHHANLRVRILDVEDDGRLRLHHVDTVLSELTKPRSVSHVSHGTGVVNTGHA